MLPKKQRLTKNQVDFVFRKGKSASTCLFIAKCFPNKINSNRFCVVVSKKIDNRATERNHLRRQIYEAIRIPTKILSVHNRNLDCIIIVKQKNKTSNFSEIKKGIIQLFKRLK